MKTILITGVSRGIGKALAETFLENGYAVIGTTTTGKIKWSHKSMTVLELDLSQPKSIAGCAKKIAGLDKKIDILINNAGIVVEDEIDKAAIDIGYLRRTLEVNVIGTIDFTEKIIPLIKEGGQIINMSSRAGSLNPVGYHLRYPSYRISKTAINMLTRILASRLEGKIKVSSVHPGWVKTDMGGDEADLEPKEAAKYIFDLANSPVESGQFWFKQEKFPW